MKVQLYRDGDGELRMYSSPEDAARNLAGVDGASFVAELDLPDLPTTVATLIEQTDSVDDEFEAGPWDEAAPAVEEDVEYVDGSSDPYGVDGAPLNVQIQTLSEFIVNRIPGEPSRSNGAVATAIRLLEDAYCRGVSEPERGLAGEVRNCYAEKANIYQLDGDHPSDILRALADQVEEEFDSVGGPVGVNAHIGFADSNWTGIAYAYPGDEAS